MPKSETTHPGLTEDEEDEEDDSRDSMPPQQQQQQEPPHDRASLSLKWKRQPAEPEHAISASTTQNKKPSHSNNVWQEFHGSLGRVPVVLVATLLWAVFLAAGVAAVWVSYKQRTQNVEEEALQTAVEAGEWFADQLDVAILPLFSMAQFATHLQLFRTLPDTIGPAYANGSLPFVPDSQSHRNVTGVCDNDDLVATFTEIASDVKRHANMDGILVNIQLAPAGVICLLHPIINTEDFEDGQYLDNTGAWGLDLFTDVRMRFIALQSIVSDEVGVAGPLRLTQCPTCDPFFIARLPVYDESHNITVDGVDYPRWGFATALIAWQTLVERKSIVSSFADRGFSFQLTRTDQHLNLTTGEYESQVVVLAETPDFVLPTNNWRYHQVFADLLTTNNEWRVTVVYNHAPNVRWMAGCLVVCFLVSLGIAYLVYTVLQQKQEHARMVGDTLAQQAKVTTERNMTAYFAHELRNPLSALDSALRTMEAQQEEAEAEQQALLEDDGNPNSQPSSNNNTTNNSTTNNTKELLDGMQLCSSFMSSIMNNLLDVRKMEEGKMEIKQHVLSLAKLVDDSKRMLASSVRPGVHFRTVQDTVQQDDWVLGDAHRIQQVLTNVVTNAIKYTQEGSITLRVSWIHMSMDERNRSSSNNANKNDAWVQFECIDTGPGIPKSQQTKLFERFVQRGGAPGTGLGLYIAQQIVTMMKGTIQFISDPTIKAGTTCRILLPLEPCPPEQLQESVTMTTRQEQHALQHRQEPIQEAISVLIMDDIKINRSMLQRRIEKAIAPHATVVMAQTGEEALKICESRHFDILICDQYMEQAGGVLVGTDVIFALRRKKVQSFIIGCSGNDLDQVFYEAGADMVWGKPMPSNAEIIEQWRDGLRVCNNNNTR